MATDPVCGMEVKESQAPAKTTHQGQTYYFCAEACKQEFEKHPQRYLETPRRGCCCCH
jgi:YHS domain-containing protein